MSLREDLDKMLREFSDQATLEDERMKQAQADWRRFFKDRVVPLFNEAEEAVRLHPGFGTQLEPDVYGERIRLRLTYQGDNGESPFLDLCLAPNEDYTSLVETRWDRPEVPAKYHNIKRLTGSAVKTIVTGFFLEFLQSLGFAEDPHTSRRA